MLGLLRAIMTVVVSAITCTFSVSKLLTKPMVFNVAKKNVFPLQQQKYSYPTNSAT